MARICSRVRSTSPSSQRETVVWGTGPFSSSASARPKAVWLVEPRAARIAAPSARRRAAAGEQGALVVCDLGTLERYFGAPGERLTARALKVRSNRVPDHRVALLPTVRSSR